MDIKANAVAHFRGRLNQEMKCVEVPEWGDGDEPARVYYKPMTGEQRDKIFVAMQGGRLQTGFATALACRARYDNGKFIWGGTDIQVQSIMREYDPDVVQRVASAMGSMDELMPEDLQDIEGNSETP